MAKDKKSFILYTDLIHTVDQMPDEVAGKLFKTILEYVNDLNPKPDDLLLKIAFEPVKRQLKRDLNKWEQKQDSQSIGGKEGNLKRWHPDLYKDYTDGKITLTDAYEISNRSVSDKTQSDPISSIGVNVNVNVTDIDILSEFEEFWSIYDKKVDRKKSLSKFMKLSKKDREDIMNHLPKYIKSTPDKKFRKNPTTYLNGETWKDEHLPQVKSNTLANYTPVKRPEHKIL